MNLLMRMRNSPGAAFSAIVVLVSELAAILLPIADVDMLGNENVLQILGVILAGQLAILALTVPALLEVRATVLESRFANDLLGFVDKIARELRSNTLASFLMFGFMFAASVLLEASPDVLSASLPSGTDVNTLFAGIKVALVVISLLVMWDSVAPLFGLGEAMSFLRRGKRQAEVEAHGKHIRRA